MLSVPAMPATRIRISTLVGVSRARGSKACHWRTEGGPNWGISQWPGEVGVGEVFGVEREEAIFGVSEVDVGVLGDDDDDGSI